MMTEPLGFVVLAKLPKREHRLTALNCKVANGKGYPVSSGNVCYVCANDEYIYKPVSAVFPEYPNGLEQAQNVLEGCQDRERRWRLEAMSCRARGDGIGERIALDELALIERDPVEYVIGEITERTPCGE